MGGARQPDVRLGAESVRRQRIVASHINEMHFYFFIISEDDTRTLHSLVVRHTLSQAMFEISSA